VCPKHAIIAVNFPAPKPKPENPANAENPASPANPANQQPIERKEAAV
jgi:hypothetical protein